MSLEQGGRASTERALRLATLNVWGRAADWPRRLEALIACWPRIDADVLLLQEVERDPTADQAAEVAAALGFDTAIAVDGHSAGERHEGLALLSRLPVERSYGWPLPPSEPVRRALVAEIAADGIPLTVINAHTVFMPAQARCAQIAALLGRPESPLVVAGDLNTTPAELVPMLEENRIADAHAGRCERPTWPTSGPAFAAAWARATGCPPHFRLDPKRIDYLLTRGLRVSCGGTDSLRAADGAHASDHALVWADCSAGGADRVVPSLPKPATGGS